MKEICFSDTFFKKIREYTPYNFCTEEGGTLLAKVYSNYIIVEDITISSKFDKKGKFFFWRNKKIHQQEITSKWKTSNRLLHYVGEWHTHPEDKPIPSSIDRKEMQNAYRNNKFFCSFLVQVIIGYKYIWVGYVSDNMDLKHVIYIDYMN